MSGVFFSSLKSIQPTVRHKNSSQIARFQITLTGDRLCSYILLTRALLPLSELAVWWGRKTTETMLGPSITATYALQPAVWSHENTREAVAGPLDRWQTEAGTSIFLGLDHNPLTSEVSFFFLFFSSFVYLLVIFSDSLLAFPLHL